MPPVGKFRVLVADDSPVTHDELAELLQGQSDLEFIRADTKTQAEEAIRDRYVDLAILDIEFHNSAAGTDLLLEIAKTSINTDVIVYSKYLRTEQVELLETLVGKTTPKIIMAMDKTGDRQLHDLTEQVIFRMESWKESRVECDDLDALTDAVWNKAKKRDSQAKKRDPKSRKVRAREELSIEIDRILRRLFGLAEGWRTSPLSVSIVQLDKLGLSAAVTLEVKLHLGADGVGKQSEGLRGMLKIGPRKDIQREVERYDRWVRYGVKLSQRVEMLGSTLEDSLGGVIYSFAGGVFGERLMTLDALIQRELPNRDSTILPQAIESLIGGEGKSWYDVVTEPHAPKSYVNETYSTKLAPAHERLVSSLINIQKASMGTGRNFAYIDDKKDDYGQFQYDAGNLRVPRVGLAPSSKVENLNKRRESCLVHGDMHGGNVMIELLGEGHGTESISRVCLIDYASAGPGPRVVDFLALEGSLRLNDAKRIEGQHSEDEPEAIWSAAQCVHEERRLFDNFHDPELSSNPGLSHCSALSALIRQYAHANFDDLTLSEYCCVALPIVMRQCGFGDLSHVQRVRMLAWLSAIHEALEQAPDGDLRNLYVGDTDKGPH